MAEILSWIDRTMLLERSLGVLTYVLVVVSAYLALSTAKGTKRVNNTLNITLFILSMMAFLFIPDPSKDLYRWLVIADGWKAMSLYDFATNFIVSSTTPLAYLIIYITTKNGVVGLLPMLCAVIFYGNVFHILKDIYKRFEPSTRAFSLSFLFFMAIGSFLEVISGVRCFVSLSIVARCIYDELVAHKNFLLRLPVYLCACLIHPSALPVFLFRLLFHVFAEKKRNMFHMVFSWVVVISVVAVVLIFGQHFIINMFRLAAGYLFEERYTYFWEYLIGVIQWFAMMYTVYFLRNGYKFFQPELYQLQRFLTAFLFVNLFLIFEYNLFHRFLVISSVLFIPYLANVKYITSAIKYKILCHRIFLFSVLIFLIVCVRGNLCGYKFLLL